jgi:hypothetical protein
MVFVDAREEVAYTPVAAGTLRQQKCGKKTFLPGVVCW